MKNQAQYRAAIYVRLSKEDGDSFSIGKNESNSITNQKLLIRKHLEQMPDIKIVDTFEDDGFTGTNFDRPGFQSLMAAIHAYRVNCVVVKDFSRLGREYLKAGNYIEKVFPQLGVRFISVNDGYDSRQQRGQTDSLLIPFKNLMNEQYSRDTSGKVRSALAVKRQQGMYVANYAPFGYMRDPADKGHLIIDETAAEVVREIYKLKIEGYSSFAIAKRLSDQHIPSPAEYKRQCGERYKSGFKTAPTASWSPVAVKRILTNEVYCGHLIQGKRRKISYKVKALEQIAEEEWARVENTHEAIIPTPTFKSVQKLLGEDTHIGKGNVIYPLSGKVYCADCGDSMTRKTVSCNGKQYAYYVCANNRANRTECSSHSIRVDMVEAAVLESIRAHIALTLNIENAMSELDNLAWEQREQAKLQRRIDLLDAEIKQYQDMRLSLYEDLQNQLIEKEDFDSFLEGFAAKTESAKQAQEELRAEMSALANGNSSQQSFLREFYKYRNIQSLDRGVVVSMIDCVLIGTGKVINIQFRYADQLASFADYCNPDGAQLVTAAEA